MVDHLRPLPDRAYGLSDVTKFDPTLLEKIESSSASEQNEVLDIMVALARPADEHELEQLREAGLDLRSTIGDILTGSIKLGRLSKLAESGLVIQIEASRPLYPEYPSDETEA